MKRSGGVTAAAVVLIVASAFVAFFSLMMVLGAIIARAIDPAHVAQLDKLLIGPVIAMLIAAWGIAAGIGILRLRRWAWVSMLAISVLLIGVALFPLHSALKLIRATTGIPTVSAGGFVAFQYVSLAVESLVPLALGLWWFLLFTRKSVRAQFAPGAFLSTEMQPAGSPAVFIPPPEGAPPRRPASITVIAIFLLLGVAAFPILFFYPVQWRIVAVFGVVVTGRAVLVLSGIYAAASLALGVGLLRLKRWARVGTIVYAVANMVNMIASIRAQRRVLDMFQRAMGMPKLPGADAQMFQRSMHAGMVLGSVIGIVSGVGFTFVAIYFLVTRRAAFYAPPPSPRGAIAPEPSALDASPAPPPGGASQ
ncbi:MAG: hypothetical protein WBD23_13970 [Candidatus Acidiferrales bacterium]